ncbi:MAG: FMN-binding glutamate synthase family protein [Deltaproteobacteria bacterium]|jgi:glutamate synthase domain-containing protein 2|nr:FMN-binding glutamate synthase family protein [Deltaproteobacteria bacterium]
MMQWPKSNDALGTINRGNPAESGLCTLCRADCAGKCETWLSSLRGRDTLYPRDFGIITAGAENTLSQGCCYSALRIQGYHYGAFGESFKAPKGDVLFTDVNLETSFGRKQPVKCRYPFVTGALGSTAIAARYWDSFASGSALCGIPIVVGENVVGIDRKAEIAGGKISKAPELDRRIETYLRYYDGYGAILVQLNVEDARNGVAEYVMDKFGDKVAIELKWGQGAKDIGGEIAVKDIEYAKFLQQRGYLLDPDPSGEAARAAAQNGQAQHFARHSRLGYTNLHSYAEVRKDFLTAVKRLRKLGFKHITLKTGAYGMEGLAMAMRLAADADLDLLSVDGAGGGTGMSPWDMMEHWGVPSLQLHTKAHEYATLLAARGIKPVDMSFGGGFARSSAIFKGLALGAPFAKLIIMGRAMMIPGFLGSNIEGVLKPANKAKVNGNWDELPKSVSQYGNTPESIFAGYYSLRDKIGTQAVKEVPFGAIAMWTLVDKLAAGLQQFMAGCRRFTLKEIRREDIAAGNYELARETGLQHICDARDEAAKSILNS